VVFHRAMTNREQEGTNAVRLRKTAGRERRSFNVEPHITNARRSKSQREKKGAVWAKGGGLQGNRENWARPQHCGWVELTGTSYNAWKDVWSMG